MKTLKIGVTLSLLGTVLGMGCNPNLDTRKVVPQNIPAPTAQQQPGTVSSASPSPSGSPSSSPSSSPTPTGTPVCPASTISLSQVSGGSLVQWVGQSSDISSTVLAATALTAARLNTSEGLYLSVIADTSNNAAIGLFHCDSETPTTSKIMNFAWMTSTASGIGGGNDPSVSDSSSSVANCPSSTSSALLAAATQALPSGSTPTQFEAVRVRGTATESLYFATGLSSKQVLFAALLHCDEKTPNTIDVLGTALSSDKGTK